MVVARAKRKIVWSDPEWEKRKASRRNLRHDDAVQESAYLQQQFRNQWSDRFMALPVDMNEILRTLAKK